MTAFSKDTASRGGLLGTYTSTLGTVISRRRSEAALAAAKVEAELANRAKSEFLANMSHELRTPLNAIIGFAQVLHEGIGVEKPSERQRDYMRDIDQAGRHLLGIISEILDIAKIESGSFELDIEEYELAEILSDCTRLVAERFTGKKQRLVVDLEPGLPNVRIDGRRIKQVLLNLLSNAHKFTPESGRVDLIARRTPAGGADIIVRDTGIGMSPEGLMLAMRPFGQVQSAYSRSHDGTGLGLPIAKGLIELHGGKLEMTSQPGVGTSVRVRLPPDCIAPRSAKGQNQDELRTMS